MKRIVLLSTLTILLLTLVACDINAGPTGLSESNENPITQNNTSPIEEPVKEPAAPEASIAEETKKDGYWELYDSQMIIPQNQTIGDQNPLIEYEFSSNETSISLNTVRTGKDDEGTGGTEKIQTYGSWTVPEKEYFAGHTIRINLEVGITEFTKVWTNNSGVNVYAYIGSENTPFGPATEKVLRDNDGKGTCSAVINNGMITVGQANKEVSITVHEGSANQKMLIFVVVSNQGKQGGVMYYYAWQDW